MKFIMGLALSLSVMTNVYAESNPIRLFTDEQWREDILQYVDLVKSTHIAMYHSVSEEDFQHAVETLLNEVPQLTDHDIAMEMVAIAALIGDGHTWTSFGDAIIPAFLPIMFYEFEDGIFITNALPGYEEHIGKRVNSIEDTPVEKLLERTPRYTSRDNQWGLLNSRASWLANKLFLTHEKIIPFNSNVSINLSTSENNEEVVNFDFIPRVEYLEEYKKIPTKPDNELPLYRTRASENYWMEFLRKEKTLFVKFNAVQNGEKGPRLGKFTNEIIKFIDNNKVQKLVIDIRHNGGGNGDLTTRMIREFSKKTQLNQPGRLFVITGRHTFSAALMFTARMERGTEALFAGEPGAGKPNSYGEFNAFTLTHSGLYGSISSRWHEEGDPDDSREYIPVDIPAPLHSKDFFTGKDPVLEAILAY